MGKKRGAKKSTESSVPKSYGSNGHEKKAHLQEPFLANFLKAGTILQGAKLTGVSSESVEYWRKHDPEFEALFQKTDALITQQLETAAFHRAVYGTTEYILHNGKLVRDAAGEPVVKKWFSDTLLMFLLKSRDRDKYSDRMKYDFDERIADQISAAVVSAVQKIAPEFCPGCKTHLGLPAKMREELKSLSAKLSIS